MGIRTLVPNFSLRRAESVQIGLFDDGILPKPVYQLLASHDLPALFQQYLQQFKFFWRQRDRFAMAKQTEYIQVHPIGIKPESGFFSDSYDRHDAVALSFFMKI